MALGTAGVFSIHARRAANDPATNTFTEYTDYCSNIVVKQRLNQPSTIEGVLLSVDTASEKLDIVAGSYLYVLAGAVLVDKFVLEQPQYNTDGSVVIRGVASTGVNDLPRKLLTESFTRTYYDTAVSSVVGNTGSSPRGIVVEDDDTLICLIDGTNNGGSTKVNLNFASANRLTALTEACKSSNQEWYFDYGSNDATPFNEGDELNIVSRKGSGTSQYTFDLSSTAQNTVMVENNTENASVVNDVNLYGLNLANTRIKTNVYHATTIRTTLNGSVDSWLAADLGGDTADTTVSLTSVGAFANSDKILVGGEYMTVVSGAGTTTLTVTRGVSSTTVISHKKGSDVVRVSAVGVSTISIVLTNAASFASSGSVYIGSELVSYTGKTSNTLTGCTRAAIGSAYAHGNGAPVYVNTSKDAPSSGSSIYSYGLCSRSYDAIKTSTINDMDILAERIITNFASPATRITIQASEPLDVLETSTVEVGDDITINNSNLENISDGEYRVIGMDISYNQGVPDLFLHCLDDDVRVSDAEGYLLYFEKLVEHSDFERQSANYLGADNIDKIFTSSTEMWIAPGAREMIIWPDVGYDCYIGGNDISLVCDVSTPATGQNDIDLSAEDGSILAVCRDDGTDSFRVANNNDDILFDVAGDGSGIFVFNDLDADDYISMHATSSDGYIEFFSDGIASDFHLSNTCDDGDLFLEIDGAGFFYFKADANIVASFNSGGDLVCGDINCDIITSAGSDPAVLINNKIYATRFSESTANTIEYLSKCKTNADGIFTFDLSPEKWLPESEEWLFCHTTKNIMPFITPLSQTTFFAEAKNNQITVHTSEPNTEFTLMLKGTRIDATKGDINSPHPDKVKCAMDAVKKKIVWKHSNGVWRDSRETKTKEEKIIDNNKRIRDDDAHQKFKTMRRGRRNGVQ
jgi:hypothetical protein